LKMNAHEVRLAIIHSLLSIDRTYRYASCTKIGNGGLVAINE
jgi:hypothetical protein